MIKYNPRQWFGLIFRFHKSDTFRKMFWVLFFYAIATTILVFSELHFEELLMFSNAFEIHSLLGFVISLLLVFRTNSAYDRWWEGRILWGSMVNNCRNFSIKINAILADSDKESRDFYMTLIPNYVYAMKEHLREGVNMDELTDSKYLPHDLLKKAKHKPNRIAMEMYTKLHKLHKEGSINGDQLITVDKELNAFTDIIGACERIKNTPIPFSYNLFLKKFIFVYTITLPLGIAQDFYYWTVPIDTFVLYIFGSLELLAEEIEDPFGRDSNDLDTDGLSKKIKENVIEILS